MQVEKRYESKDRYDQMTDEELVALAQSGETQAEEYLIRKYELMVQVWSRPYFLQGAEDDDLLQEGRIGLFKAIRDFNHGSSNFWSFAKLCIIRNIISAIKGTTRQKHIPLNSYTSLYKSVYDSEGDRALLEVITDNKVVDPEAIVIDREKLKSTKYFISMALSEFEYKVFILYLNGLSYKEMAERLHTHTKSVDNALCRVKSKIQKELVL
ncbi:MAG TPA: RNA polymerase sporulation sigma factor SigH [Bacillota bacterium]|nr:RNA polymerase sporulation sigma factor SigH [Bacillota bacterium]HOL13086.1 RNA polymerase sporulation sigma factor SigH [Bacillota bacterium]HOP53501.1 RNA polymerase sporulation sigma factor SigH [Bacillota bacterium]HPT61394.1 RNA polymerase sporulation sigma factor SigH [Bacillota bacterium]HPZ74166.1 RNA polymerase sporulation sigma factor SigH [Bacillota bacterium]